MIGPEGTQKLMMRDSTDLVGWFAFSLQSPSMVFLHTPTLSSTCRIMLPQFSWYDFIPNSGQNLNQLDVAMLPKTYGSWVCEVISPFSVVLSRTCTSYSPVSEIMTLTRDIKPSGGCSCTVYTECKPCNWGRCANCGTNSWFKGCLLYTSEAADE